MDFQLEQFQLCDWQRIVLEIFCAGAGAKKHVLVTDENTNPLFIEIQRSIDYYFLMAL